MLAKQPSHVRSIHPLTPHPGLGGHCHDDIIEMGRQMAGWLSYGDDKWVNFFWGEKKSSYEPSFHQTIHELIHFGHFLEDLCTMFDPFGMCPHPQLSLPGRKSRMFSKHSETRSTAPWNSDSRGTFTSSLRNVNHHHHHHHHHHH